MGCPTLQEVFMKAEHVVFVGMVGLGAGLLLGLALAPRSGRDTQALVKQKTREGLDQLAASGKRVGSQLQDLADKGKELAARGKEELADALEAGKRAYAQATHG
jgi:gas vesicle protein